MSVIPGFKKIQDFDSDAAKDYRGVLDIVVNHLCTNLEWLQALTTKQKFCWRIVASYCSKISIGSFDLANSCSQVIAILGRIYYTYCTAHVMKLACDENVIITEELPMEIQHNPSPDVKG